MGNNYLKILLYLFLLMLWGACHSSGPVKRELVLADSLMEENPDTAMYLLQTITKPEIMTEEEYAVYCLLTTQAADLTNKPHTTDEQISKALSFFENSNNTILLSKCYYYMARVKEDMGNTDEAEKNFLLAASTIEKTNNYKQTALIYSSISKFYKNSGRYKESLEMQQKAYNNNLLAVRAERNLSPIIIILPVAIIIILLLLLIRYQIYLRKEKRKLDKQEKKLNNAVLTIDTQKIQLNELNRELKQMRKSVYNASDIVRKIQLFNNIPINAKEKPSLTDHEWIMYLNVLEENFGFVSYLKKTYHKLTEIDIRICALLREGISTNHISTIMNMSPDTLSRRMQRIKSEKMNQSKSARSLDLILRSI